MQSSYTWERLQLFYNDVGSHHMGNLHRNTLKAEMKKTIKKSDFTKKAVGRAKLSHILHL